jgi:hypothetical protein
MQIATTEIKLHIEMLLKQNQRVKYPSNVPSVVNTQK